MEILNLKMLVHLNALIEEINLVAHGIVYADE